MIQPIVIYPDERLRKVQKTVKKITPEIENIITDMRDTMEHYNALGIAAIQIGQPYSIFLMNPKHFPILAETYDLVFINPVVRTTGGADLFEVEGCLSIPNISVEIPRPLYVVLEYGLIGNRGTIRLFSSPARCALHEIDHINGRLIVDYEWSI